MDTVWSTLMTKWIREGGDLVVWNKDSDTVEDVVDDLPAGLDVDRDSIQTFLLQNLWKALVCRILILIIQWLIWRSDMQIRWFDLEKITLFCISKKLVLTSFGKKNLILNQ